MSKEISIYDKTSYKEMIQKNIYNTIEFLLKEGIEFSIICYTNFIEFNPSIPSEIIEFNEITLFAIAGYSYESSTITKTNFTFEAGFGEQNYGSYLKVPLEACTVNKKTRRFTMKKGLLLSVVASGVIFAGGNIAPVQPVQQVAPAACDFWGTLALRYDAIKDANGNFGTAKNNKAVAALAMGVEKQLGYGFGFGAELDGLYALDGKFNKKSETADLMQAYLTYKAGNTAIKAGRQALPKTVSPWVYTDLVGAWVASVHDFGNGDKKITGNSDKGLFALGAIYKGIQNTTLSGTLYYIPSEGAKGKAISAWTAVQSKVNNVDLGLQLAYAKADAN